MDKGIRPEAIEALVAEFEASGCAELHVRFEGFELHLSSDRDTQTVSKSVGTSPQVVARPVPSEAAASSGIASARQSASVGPQDLASFQVVHAPYLGSFYRSPKPGSAPYVEVGSKVEADTELCLVEVMKLFTAVRAGVAGTIAHILVPDGQMVEAGQPLFAIDTGN